jgi:predicted Zn-dependent protease with MMP-like domain
MSWNAATAERLMRVANTVITSTRRRLPEPILRAAEACITETELMAECLDAGEAIEEDLLGLFEGCSLADGEPEMPGQLPRIRLFLDNLWDHAGGDMSIFRDEVRITWLHELGHYLGLDENQVAALGLA